MPELSIAKGNRWLMFTYKGRPRIVRHYRWKGDTLLAVQIAGLSGSGTVGPKHFKEKDIENMVEFYVLTSENGMIEVSQSTPYSRKVDGLDEDVK
ncbi:MAG: hypothetical protein MPJ04_08215 [Nitrosopumilus sp.]|nr:hypothetical protein [Nitrosopumilus sp.]MDA7955416.1 hypothetical protein [Nitrosopumilus sp.]MDA7997390.1 hypothetical protein [Nitrosopumilus sp.]MDA8000829.1 hypothetical protein [Alphaproteobacteria bacterium]